MPSRWSVVGVTVIGGRWSVVGGCSVGGGFVLRLFECATCPGHVERLKHVT